MLFLKSVFLAFCLCYFGFISSHAQSISQLQNRADSLYTNFLEQEAFEAYQKVLEKDSANFEALWRTSFLYSRIGHRKEEEEVQEEYYQKAKLLAERALAIDSTHSQANFVMGVAMGRMALISGTKERVAASRAIKKYASRAIRYDSTNAGAWHLLGRWNFRVANLSFVERLAANTLFGGISGDASTEKAVEYIQKAIALDNRFILYYHDLAEAYAEMGRKDNATNACKKALEKESLNAKDDDLKADCRNWIKKWKE
ncbi:MAG: hypothetical protein U5J95_04460 [Balneolaceae bacterium]|nr:hypothetical protein [Balneolaceae bacterium]